MPEEWLIDGFNLLYRFKNRQLSALFGLVADFAASKHCIALVVLDGKGNEEEYAAFQTPSLQIRYSREVSADAVIERRLCEKKGQAVFVVVTGDRAITQMARGSGDRHRRVYFDAQPDQEREFRASFQALDRIPRFSPPI